MSVSDTKHQVVSIFYVLKCHNSSTDLIHHSGLQVHQHGPGHVFPGVCLREEGVEGVIRLADAGVSWHHAVRLENDE